MLKAFLVSAWPWYVTGPAIGAMVPLLFWTGGKSLGISASFRHICSMALPRTKVPFLSENEWKKELWNLLFVAGIALGGFIGIRLLGQGPAQLLPTGYASATGAVKLLIGGFLVGFGSRYAGGCTSGHAITGLSTLQKASLVSVAAFFAGGLAAAAASYLIER
jgi:uncharacterized membrane protein YedE/YeeE